jgi:two-component system NarL family response regulator
MSHPDPIKILVLHQDPVANAGLCATFRQHCDFIVAARDSCTMLEQLCADVIVADFAGGIRAAELIGDGGVTRRRPHILIVADKDREWQIRTAMDAGVRGYIVLGSALEPLVDGARALHRGARYLSPQVAARLAESLALEPLTTREEEVLRLVTRGLCNKAIGRQLGIAVGTVKSHLKSTFDKLDVQSRTQAVAIVERRGLLQEPIDQVGVRQPNDLPAAASRFLAPADRGGRALAGAY